MINILSTLLIILVILAVFHFVYEKILLPNIRWNLRNQLFALRDSLRNIAINNQADYDQKVFDLLHSAISYFLNRLHYLDINTELNYRKQLKNNPDLQRKVEKNLALIENSNNQEMKDIFEKANKILKNAFIANMGINFIYIVPIILFFLAIKKLSSLLLKTLIAPAYCLNRLFPKELHSS